MELNTTTLIFFLIFFYSRHKFQTIKNDIQIETQLKHLLSYYIAQNNNLTKI